MKSQLNCKNKIKAANTCAVLLMRTYGTGTIKWNKEELQKIDTRKSRKIMTMNELHPRCNVAR